MPAASLIVPAFNVARTLGATLDSLVAQTFTDFEIIVVNDGSTDALSPVLDRFASEPRLRVIDQRNRGLAAARNSGIDAARADVIEFCDSDDIWEPTKFAAHILKRSRIGNGSTAVPF